MRIVVVGSGVAGLTAALRAAHLGHEVVVLTKSRVAESNTRYAQGGVAVVTSPDDSVAGHVADTLVAGAGLSDVPAVELLCGEGPDAIATLIAEGVAFDRDANGDLLRGLEAAHSHPRILHAGGDATGAAIAFGLIEEAKRQGLDIREETTVVDVVLSDGHVSGVALLDGAVLDADVVVLASGGAGQLYPYTTNPAVATADGLAIALRAGAVAADLEFFQFHPTALATPGSHLISEAVRGEGAVLLDAEGKRFMTAVHPDAELAPRDVVARGIAAQMAAQGGRPVRLDATALGAEFLVRRFPTIDRAVRAQGFDWAREPIPVSPAAHYFMGGVRTDVFGRTSVPGLLAVGEVACTGLHGANRLASNSLLEGAVYGLRVVDALALDLPESTFDETWGGPVELPSSAGTESFGRSDLQQVMWDSAGVMRDGVGLAAGREALDRWAAPEVTDAKSAEDANLLLVARAVVRSAEARRSSRGAHHRDDYPQAAPGSARHSAVKVAL